MDVFWDNASTVRRVVGCSTTLNGYYPTSLPNADVASHWQTVVPERLKFRAETSKSGAVTLKCEKPQVQAGKAAELFSALPKGEKDSSLRRECSIFLGGLKRVLLVLQLACLISL